MHTVKWASPNLKSDIDTISLTNVGRPEDTSTLQRKGAQAAARGASWRSNPFLLRENMPQATGESLADWSGQHDAWQRGFEGYFQLGPDFARRPKEPLSALLLKTLVERRLRWLPRTRAHLAAHPQSELRLPVPTEHERDHAGRNWDMERLECGSRDDVRLQVDLRSIVERLRRQYDIAPCAGAVSGQPQRAAIQAARSEPIALLSEAGMPATDGVGPPEHPVPASLCPGPMIQGVPDAPGRATLPAQDSESRQLMQELGIRRIGWRYEYRGYRYDRLADAVAYARLNREVPRSGSAPDAGSLVDEAPRMPDKEERLLMTQWGIEFEAGIYRFRSYRYERLGDAVAYARLLAGRPGMANDASPHGGR